MWVNESYRGLGLATPYPSPRSWGPSPGTLPHLRGRGLFLTLSHRLPAWKADPQLVATFNNDEDYKDYKSYHHEAKYQKKKKKAKREKKRNCIPSFSCSPHGSLVHDRTDKAGAWGTDGVPCPSENTGK